LIFVLRIAIGFWLIVSLVMATAYGGTLFSFLSTKRYSKTIRTYSEVLSSKIPFDMVLYGEELETSLAKTTEPVTAGIWQGKQVVEFQQVISDRVINAAHLH
jgi:hypothetical protein